MMVGRKVMFQEIADYWHKITAWYIIRKEKLKRIAALRKEYDDYLEEDKKRKERNDFILGRMERMRLHNVVDVPVKKTTILRERPSTIDRPAPNRQSSLLKRPLGVSLLQTIGSQRNIAAKINQSETALLEEIGKKYILIPRSSTTEYYSNANMSDFTDALENGDWKSKYNILDELKSADIEGIEHYSTNDPFSIDKHHHNTNARDAGAPDHESSPHQDPSLKFKEEVPEKDIHIHYKEADYGIQNYPKKTEDNNKKICAINSKDENIEHPKSNYLKEPNEINYYKPEREMESGKHGEEFMPLYGSQTKLGYKVVESNQDNELNNHSKQNSAAQDTHNLNLTETLKAAEYNRFGEAPSADISNAEAKHDNTGFVNEVNAQVTFENYGKDSDVEKVIRPVENPTIIQDINNMNPNGEEPIQYPLELINAKEFTPHEGVILKYGENINPEDYYTNPAVAYSNDSQQELTGSVAQPELTSENALNPTLTENNEQPQTNEEDTEQAVVQNCDIEQIQEFEAEQENMFYQDPNTTYDLASGDAGYTQDANYQGNEQNQYYEGVGQEQNDPVEINEHLEASERYDPSYPEQYDPTQYDYTQQGYEQQGYEQQGYEQQGQHQVYGLQGQQQGYEQGDQQGFEQGEHQGYEQEVEQPVYEQQAGQQACAPQGYEQGGYDQPVAEEYTQPQFGAPAAGYDMNQTPQQYQETEQYDLQVPYEEGNETVQSVEQQLDYEQGFSETETRAAEQLEQVGQK